MDETIKLCVFSWIQRKGWKLVFYVVLIMFSTITLETIGTTAGHESSTRATRDEIQQWRGKFPS